jgi:hypothetical protein
MQIALPKSDVHPQVRITVKTPAGDIQVTTDDSHKFCEIDLPAGVVEEDVEVIAEFCTRSGQPDPGACQIILKEREPANVHVGSETEPAESGLHVRLEDSAVQSGSEADSADAEVGEETDSDQEAAVADDETLTFVAPNPAAKKA